MRTASLEPPVGLLAELTHRCPLQCPYCSNPVELAAARGELSTDEWARVFEQAAAIGVLQLHLSGGEPTLRADLSDLVRHARQAGLYTNLITAGVLLDEERLDRLVLAGLDHVQLSLQGTDPAIAERIGGYRGGHTKKLAAAALVRQAGLPLTVNAVVHRQNLDQLDAMIALALELEAERLEVAHVQYYGWALRNRAALMPSRKQLDRATATVEAARASLAGRLLIDYVVPDYYARRPKPCMGGWGRAMLAITPQGLALPCHAAQTIPGLVFPDVRVQDLAWIWRESPAFRRFRGHDWMQEPCRSCERRDVDFGGCRCQAAALTGDPDATDPACSLSPRHQAVFELATGESAAPPPPFVYRRYANAAKRRAEMPEAVQAAEIG
jgi:PqqA peptide cyclase